MFIDQLLQRSSKTLWSIISLLKTFRFLMIVILLIILHHVPLANSHLPSLSVPPGYRRHIGPQPDPTELLQTALLDLDTNEVSNACANGIQYLRYGLQLQHSWAYRLMDSFGRAGSGQLNGNLFWPGQYRECLEVLAPYLELNKQQSFQKLRGQFCVGWMRLALETQVEVEISIGVCAPHRCTNEDLARLEVRLPQLTRLDCVDPDYRRLTTSTVIFIILCFLPFMLSIVGTLMDFKFSKRSIRDQYKTLREVDREQRRLHTLPSISSSLHMSSSNPLNSNSTCVTHVPTSSADTPSLPASPESGIGVSPSMMHSELPKLSLNLNLNANNRSPNMPSLQLNFSPVPSESPLQLYLQNNLPASSMSQSPPQIANQSPLTALQLFAAQQQQNYQEIHSRFRHPQPDLMPASMPSPSHVADFSGFPTDYDHTQSIQLNLGNELPDLNLDSDRSFRSSSNQNNESDPQNSTACAVQSTPVYTADGVELIPQPFSLQHKLRNKTLSLCTQILTCFSLRQTIRVLTSTHQSRGHPHYAIRCLYALKFFSLLVVMIGHCYDVYTDVLSNPDELNRDMHNLLFYPLLNGTFAVDTFFTISGVLLAYTFFIRKGQVGPSFWTPSNLLRFYFNRYWRLVGVYALVLAFYIKLSPHLGSGPFWQSFYSVGNCSISWWKNLLFVNNLFGSMYDQCMIWTWYLANDMQFFLISPCFLALLAWRKTLGITFVLFVALCSCLANGIISYQLGLDHMPFDGNGTHDPKIFYNWPISQTRIEKFDTYAYETPYCRIGPFALGLLTGHAIHRLRNRVDISRRLQLFGYAVVIFIWAVVIYSPYQANWERLGYAIYFGCSRVLWSVGVCLFIWLCAMKPNATLNALLSAPTFVVLANLTYCAYLIHPIVQYVYIFSFKNAVSGSHAIIFMNFIGIMLFTYIFSTLLFLTVEMPLLAMRGIRLKSSVRN